MRCCGIIIYTVYISAILVIVNSELFTAVVDLQNLLHTEEEIVKTLEKYLEIEEQRLEEVRRLRREYDKLYKAASDDVETFLSNPVNAYLLVKRLTADWRDAEYLIHSSYGGEVIKNITNRKLQFPDDEDLSGAATALMRLQDTYLINTSTLACGHIEGTAPSLELTSGDCFELGRQAYNGQDYYHTLLWMQEALDRIERENVKFSDKADILEYMAYSTYMLGNISHAVKLTKELLYVEPENSRAHGNLASYTEALKSPKTSKRRDDAYFGSELQSALFGEKPETHEIPNIDEYEKLCRGEKVKSPSEESKLTCCYFTNNHPFLLLQPAKEEELNLDPRLVIYHDELSDRKIDIIKNLATPKLERAAVHSKNDLGHVSYRISKSAWLKDGDHEVIKRISHRIEAITGLETDTAEDLQVVNYGIGGHYEPHFDFATKNEPDVFKLLGTRNRIATWLYYMSNVDAGGATVFPSIGVQVKPIKGSAAFWYNLFKSGEVNFDTGHAACPVLAGSKWVSNKWLHEKGQEFRRPCSLNPNE